MSKTKKKVPNSARAKHAFGELTLKDFLPLVGDFLAITLVAEGEETIWIHFKTDNGIELWEASWDGPSWSFPPETKVKVKGDHIELDARQGDMKMYFNRLEPIEIKIL